MKALCRQEQLDVGGDFKVCIALSLHPPVESTLQGPPHLQLHALSNTTHPKIPATAGRYDFPTTTS